ncbi:MAG: hypothetical protein OXT09_14385 [Myxococcales bacterium]|nr:hypothetical protein [Myxococcales bacterium]
MAFDQEKRQAMHLLQGVENGTLRISEAARLVEEADPALVYLLLTWLRSHYGGDHPAAAGVLGRLVELNSAHGSVRARMREGKADPVVAWFEEEHGYRDFGAADFVDLVVDKLES